MNTKKRKQHINAECPDCATRRGMQYSRENGQFTISGDLISQGMVKGYCPECGFETSYFNNTGRVDDWWNEQSAIARKAYSERADND